MNKKKKNLVEEGHLDKWLPFVIGVIDLRMFVLIKFKAALNKIY